MKSPFLLSTLLVISMVPSLSEQASSSAAAAQFVTEGLTLSLLTDTGVVIDVGCRNKHLIPALLDTGRQAYGVLVNQPGFPTDLDQYPDAAQARLMEAYESRLDGSFGLRLPISDVVTSYDTLNCFDDARAVQFASELVARKPKLVVIGATYPGEQRPDLADACHHNRNYTEYLQIFSELNYTMYAPGMLAARNSMFRDMQLLGKEYWWPLSTLMFIPTPGDVASAKLLATTFVNMNLSQVLWFERLERTPIELQQVFDAAAQEYSQLLVDAEAHGQSFLKTVDELIANATGSTSEAKDTPSSASGGIPTSSLRLEADVEAGIATGSSIPEPTLAATSRQQTPEPQQPAPVADSDPAARVQPISFKPRSPAKPATLVTPTPTPTVAPTPASGSVGAEAVEQVKVNKLPAAADQSSFLQRWVGRTHLPSLELRAAGWNGVGSSPAPPYVLGEGLPPRTHNITTFDEYMEVLHANQPLLLQHIFISDLAWLQLNQPVDSAILDDFMLSCATVLRAPQAAFQQPDLAGEIIRYTRLIAQLALLTGTSTDGVTRQAGGFENGFAQVLASYTPISRVYVAPSQIWRSEALGNTANLSEEALEASVQDPKTQLAALWYHQVTLQMFDGMLASRDYTDGFYRTTFDLLQLVVPDLAEQWARYLLHLRLGRDPQSTRLRIVFGAEHVPLLGDPVFDWQPDGEALRPAPVIPSREELEGIMVGSYWHGHGIYFGATYAVPALEPLLKAVINSHYRNTDFSSVWIPLAQKAIAASQDSSLPPVTLPEGHAVPTNLNSSKIRVGVISAQWKPGHAVYRNFNAFVRALNQDERFETTLIFLESSEINKSLLDTDMFDHGFMVPINVTEATAANTALWLALQQFDVLFYTQIAMHSLDVALANARFAPLQISCYGHSSSSYGAEIDLMLGSDDIEIRDGSPEAEHYHTSLASRFSETLLRIPGLGVIFEPMTSPRPHQVAVQYLYNASNLVALNGVPSLESMAPRFLQPTAVAGFSEPAIVIPLVWTLMKINHAHLIRLRDIIHGAQAKRPVPTEIRLFPGHHMTRRYVHASLLKTVREVLDIERLPHVNLRLMPGAVQELYMYQLGLSHTRVLRDDGSQTVDVVQSAVSFDSFHFGGCNSVHDLLHSDVPVVTFEGADWRNRIAGAMLRRLGLDELVTNTTEAFVQKGIELLTSPALRHRLRRQIEQADLSVLSDTAPAAAFRDTVAVMAKLPAETRASLLSKRELTPADVSAAATEG